jgi:hypothetical protein
VSKIIVKSVSGVEAGPAVARSTNIDKAELEDSSQSSYVKKQASYAFTLRSLFHDFDVSLGNRVRELSRLLARSKVTTSLQ